MGIIQRQTIKSSIYIYLGVLIGFVNVSILYPRFLTTAQIGVITLLVSWGSLFAQFGTLGFTGATIRFFPYFRHREKGHQGFFLIMMMVFLIGSVLLSLLVLIMQDWIVRQAGPDSLLSSYTHLLIPYSIFMLLFLMLDVYNRSLYNATTGTLLNETVSRLLVMILLYPLIVAWIGFDTYVDLYVLARALLVVFLLVFLFYKKDISLRPDFSLLTPKMRKNMLSLSVFSLLTGFSAIAVMRIDAIMIGGFVSESAVGIYITTFYYGTLVSLPSRALKGIAPTLVSDAFKENKLDVVADIYRKSSITQMIAGCYLMLGIWANIDNVFEILTEEFLPGKYVIFYIALMNLVKMMAGNNELIIGYSRYYRFNTYSMLSWLILIILTNWWLLPLMGLVGAALASLISVVAVNLLRGWYLYHKFSFQPLSLRHVYIGLISLATYFIVSLVPSAYPFYLDIFIRGSLITLIYLPTVYFLKLSPEFNSLLENLLEKLKK